MILMPVAYSGWTELFAELQETGLSALRTLGDFEWIRSPGFSALKNSEF
jgi:hypothetical protein